MKKGFGSFVIFAFLIVIILCSGVTFGKIETKKGEVSTSKAAPDRNSIMKEKTDMILSRLQKSDPNEAARLEKMRSEDPNKFQMELQKSMRQIYAKEKPLEIIEREKAMGRSGINKKIQMPTPQSREELIERMYEPHLKWLRENYPAEAEKLSSLKTKEPNSYQEQLRVSLSKYRGIERASRENPVLAEALKNEMKIDEQIQGKLAEIKAAKDEKEKQKLSNELKNLAGQKVDNDLKKKQAEHEQMVKRLAKMQEQVKAEETSLAKEQDAAARKNKVEAKFLELTGSTK